MFTTYGSFQVATLFDYQRVHGFGSAGYRNRRLRYGFVSRNDTLMSRQPIQREFASENRASNEVIAPRLYGRRTC
jgi:hypothetical protein